MIRRTEPSCASGDGTQIDRLRVTTGSNGAALSNVGRVYGDAEGATEAADHHRVGVVRPRVMTAV
ncbi:hypothetical protein ACFYW9_24150 [Streptomyces sp. NPDC002698]|uniref:hypothetical protein n=1 Tax=Streptomyces sp. NPDC002698 TaxID=3364660 RepID=UPI0036C162CD